MKKLLAIIILTSLFSLSPLGHSAKAQPLPCNDPAVMTPTCQEACIICDIDGFTGINDSPVQGVAPPGFCTFGVQNITWIAFLAGSVDLILEVEVTNCQNNVGLQIGIYESFDCENFNLVSNCENSIPQNTTATFIMNQDLVIGQYYYFVMDGDLGDICNYTVTVVEGTTLVPPLPSSGQIEGPAVVCPGLSLEYLTTGQEGATIYDWTLDGSPVGSGLDVNIDWDFEGTYELCVTAANVCDEAPASCQTIVVASIPPTIFNESICEGDCFEVADTILCDAGSYQFDYITPVGCDSIVLVELENYPVVTTDIDINICDGDTVFIGGNPYFQTGIFEEVLTTYLGCDSTVTLDLTTIICEITGEIEATATQCFGESSGAINFSVSDGTPPFDYDWEQLGGVPSGNGQLNAVNELIQITDLPLGSYIITITDQFGNDVILLTEVTQPPLLESEETFSNYNGYPVSCTGSSDGFLAVQPSGGIPPYTFLWSTDATDSLITDISAGFYSVTITDFVGCEKVLAYQFFDPPPLVLAATFYDPGCDGFDTGSIVIDTAYGGVSPLLFDIGQGGPKDNEEFEDLFSGSYTLTVTDANGCTLDTTASLATPQIPTITTNSPIDVDLGEVANLQIFINLAPDSIAWNQIPGLDCYDCENPSVLPLETGIYPVTVWSEQGCIDTDTILVRVTAIRNIYIPNIFSPDYDGVNDVFYIFGGPEVAQVREFQIFDRWGDHVFRSNNFLPNDPGSGWDGTFRGQAAPSGTYTWFAEIEYIDGVIGFYEGDITIVR